MKAELLLIIFIAAAAVGKDENEKFWEKFKSTYNKTYPTKYHEARRRSIFFKHMEMIKTHNFLADIGKYSYQVGLNKFSDLTDAEFSKYLNGLQLGQCTANQCGKPINENRDAEPDEKGVPVSLDYRDNEMVTDVKDQGECGSAYAFSAVAALEYQVKKRTGKLVSLSEQDLIDCTISNHGNQGCDGGLMTTSFLEVKKKGGINSEKDYPYQGSMGSCKFNATTAFAKSCRGFRRVVTTSEVDLKAYVAKRGVLSFGIAVDGTKFRHFQFGVWDHPKCSKTMDHAMAIVGYGRMKDKDYWIAKNSWGKDWGDKGYILIRRNYYNMCGLNQQISYPYFI